MKYLIDGYNLFFNTRKDCVRFSEEREHFVSALNKLAIALHFHVHLIFDGRGDTFFSSKQQFERIEVSFSPDHLSADQYLLELLEWNSQAITLVTSDRSLLKKGALLGAKTLSVEKFLNLVFKKQKRLHCRNQKPIPLESKADFQRLRAAFEKKLNKNEEESQEL